MTIHLQPNGLSWRKNMSGSDYERELYCKAWDNGYAVMRSPSSGSGRKHPQPDLLLGYSGTAFGIEVKSTKKDRVYVSKNEILKLESFCNRFGVVPLVAVRWKGSKEWSFFDVGEGMETEKSHKFEKGMDEVSIW